MSSYKITVPNETDFPELTEVWDASVRSTHEFLQESDIQYFKLLVRNEYLKTVSLFCIKDQSGAIVGFSGISENTLEMLFVHPLHFGKGIGKRLILHAISEMGIRKVDVNEQNPSALVFYQNMGFVVSKRSPVDGTGKAYPILHLELSSAEVG
jgi:putative acetyltransferase